MKYIFLITALLFSSLSAADDITVLNMTPKASVVTTLARAVADTLDAKFYQAANCEDAFEKFKTVDNAISIYNTSVEFGARNKGLNCNIADVKNPKIIMVAKTYASICRRPGSDAHFNDKETTLGMISLYSTKAHEKTFRDAGANIKLVAFSGARTALRALYAGDVDLAWMGQGLVETQGDKLDCIASTDPSKDNYLGNQLDIKVPDFRIQYVLYTNSNDKDIIAKMNTLHTNTKFQRFLKKSQTFVQSEINDNEVELTTIYADKLFNNWAD